jgi:small neutral amino acid transporter SnatA (MarC family)
MYAFNSIQLVTLFAALPWIVNWLGNNGYDAGAWGAGFLFVVLAIFLIVAATSQLYEIDKGVRG